MPVFAYKGVTATGRSTKGWLDADSARLARTKLRHDGIFLTDLSESGDAAESSDAWLRLQLPWFRRVPAMELSIFTRQAATLISAGIPLVEGLAALTEQTAHPRLKSVLGRVRDSVNEGSTLADALAQSGTFPNLYVSMVRAGEAGGALEQVLERLADYLENQVRIRNKVTSLLIYPAVMMGFAMIVVGVLVTVVLPQITELLTSLNQTLPFDTRWIIGLSHFARDWWWALGLALAGLAVGIHALVRTERGRNGFDRMLLSLPVLGRVVRLLAIARFTRTLSTLLAGGLPIVPALGTARDVADNTVLGRAIDSARESITEGATIAAPLRASGEFPPMVTHMIAVGERSGQLESMLAKVADAYDEQVETTASRLTALLEPLLILLMVAIVLVIIMAVLATLLQVTSSMN